MRRHLAYPSMVITALCSQASLQAKALRCETHTPRLACCREQKALQD